MSRLGSVLLLGATGTIGLPILKAVAASRSSFKRVAIFTSPTTASNKSSLLADFKAQDVDVLEGDINDDKAVIDAFQDFDTIVSALGRTALHLQPRLISLIASLPGSPRRFYPSEYGTDIRYDPTTSPNEPPHQQKLKVRAHIESLAKEGKLTYTYIVTGPFADTFFVARFGGLSGYNKESSTYGIVGDGTQKISGTTYTDTGKYLVSSLKTPEASKNATIRVSSFTSTPVEMQAAIEKVVGKKLEVKYTDLEEFTAKEKKAWEEGDGWATVYTLTRIWYEGGSDFSRKPKALYLKNGEDVEDKQLEEQLFKDVPYTGLEETVREVI